MEDSVTGLEANWGNRQNFKNERNDQCEKRVYADVKSINFDDLRKTRWHLYRGLMDFERPTCFEEGNYRRFLINFKRPDKTAKAFPVTSRRNRGRS